MFNVKVYSRQLFSASPPMRHSFILLQVKYLVWTQDEDQCISVSKLEQQKKKFLPNYQQSLGFMGPGAWWWFPCCEKISRKPISLVSEQPSLKYVQSQMGFVRSGRDCLVGACLPKQHPASFVHPSGFMSSLLEPMASSLPPPSALSIKGCRRHSKDVWLQTLCLSVRGRDGCSSSHATSRYFRNKARLLLQEESKPWGFLHRKETKKKRFCKLFQLLINMKETAAACSNTGQCINIWLLPVSKLSKKGKSIFTNV